MSLHAYLDESRRRADDGTHVYVMAAVLVPGEVRVSFERDLRALVPKGSHRLHLRADRYAVTKSHLELITSYGAQGIHALTADARISMARYEGRARVRCLAALTAQLSERGVDEIVIESRQAHRDVEDDRVLLQMRQDGSLREEVLWRHDEPYGEPLLWPADAVAGAVSSMMVGDLLLVAHLPPEMVETTWTGDL